MKRFCYLAFVSFLMANLFSISWAKNSDTEKQRTVQNTTKSKKIDLADSRTQELIGLFHLEKGKLDIALSKFEKAAKLDTSRDSVLSHIGWIYYKKGDYDKSRQYYLKAYRLSKNQKYKKTAGKIYELVETRKYLEKLKNTIRKPSEVGDFPIPLEQEKINEFLIQNDPYCNS